MATRKPIILDKPEDWPTWIEEIGSSIPDDIWSLIDPDIDQDDYEEFLPKPNKPQVEEVNASKTTYPQLTSTERQVFDQLFKHYQVSLKEYERQRKGLQDAKDVIRARVSDAKSRILQRKDTPRDWLATLKKATSVSKGFISYQAAQKYYAAITRTPTVATIDKWLAAWELAMVEARKHQIPEISSGRWLRDLAATIKPLSDVLRTTFILESTDDSKSDPERYLEVSVKIREIVGSTDIKRRVTRGTTFAAEFNGEPAEPGIDNDDHHDDKDNRKRKRAGTAPGNTRGKRRKMDDCKACGLSHHKLSRCYYAFPELRHSGFNPIKAVEERVARALITDKNLIDEIEAIRKEMQEENARE